MLLCICEPEGIQTLDLQNRNLTLYSAKLRVPLCSFAGAKLHILFYSCKFLTRYLQQIEEIFVPLTYGRRHFRSKMKRKIKFSFAFYSLIRTFAPN